MKTIEISDEVCEKIKDKIVEEENLIKEKKEIKIEIKNRFTGNIIFSSTKTTMREAVEEAVEKSANLESANLESANLKYANLEYANLKYANLKYAKTIGCIINFSSAEYEQAKQFIEGLKL